MRNFNHAVTEYAKGDLQYCQYELKIIKEIISLHLEWEKTKDEDEIIFIKSQLAQKEIELIGAVDLINDFHVMAEDFPIVVDDTVLHNRSDLRWAYEHWEDSPVLINRLNSALMDALKMRQFPQ